MGLINCNTILSVGIRQFDDEHCQLVTITNQLHDAIKAGCGAQAVRTTLQQLSEFTARHFQSEEKMMEQHDFPHLTEHIQAHQDILDRLAQFQAEFEYTVQPMQHSIMQFLLDWLTNHTKTADKLYGTFLNAKGVY